MLYVTPRFSLLDFSFNSSWLSSFSFGVHWIFIGSLINVDSLVAMLFLDT